MNRAELEQLISRAADGDIDLADANMLAEWAEKDPELLEEIRNHLKISDLIDQHLDPARKTETFLNSMQTRYRAQRESATFIQATVDKIKKNDSRLTLLRLSPYTWVASVLLAVGVWMGIRVALQPTTIIESQPITVAGHVEESHQSTVFRYIVVTSDTPIAQKVETRVALTRGMSLHVGDRIVTEEKGHLKFILNDGQTLMELNESTALTIGKLETETKNTHALDAPDSEKIKTPDTNRFHLLKGQLISKAAPRPRVNPLTIHSPHAQVAITGTQFSLTVLKDESTLEVQEGLVRMRSLSDGAWQEVGPRQSAVARAGQTTLRTPGRIIKSIMLKKLFKNQLPARVHVHGAAVIHSMLYILSNHGKSLLQVDLDKKRILKELNLQHPLTERMTYDGSLLWGFEKSGRRIPLRLIGFDPTTGETRKILSLPNEIQNIQTSPDKPEPHKNESSICFGDSHLWVAINQQLFKLNPDTGELLTKVTIPIPARVPNNALQIFHANGWIYAGLERKRLHKISPESGQIVSSFPITLNPFHLELFPHADGEFWAFERASSRTLHLISLDQGPSKRKP